MWDDDIDIAKAYIKQRRYEEARDILVMMPDNYSAQRLLERLDRFQYGPRQDFSKSSNPVVINQTFQQNNSNINSNNSGCLSGIPRLAIIIIILNMIIWGSVVVIGASATSPETGIAAFILVTFFFGVTFILSYLYWKFFWWMIALSWTILTLLTFYLAQNPALLLPQ